VDAEERIVATLTTDQLTQYAQQAGFSGAALQNIVAIAQAESGGNTDAYNASDPNGGSYGVLQINGAHGLPTSCMLDPACSFKFAYQLSNNGTNFQPWSTFSNGAYKSFLGGSVSQAWYDYSPIHDFGQTFSWATYPVQGEDIPMPQDTPVTALFPGRVTSEYYDAGGGQVIIQANDPSQLKGIPYYYFVHLDNFAPGLQVGSPVSAGQLVGYSGGQNVGGSHPAAPNYSSGPHLELGLSPGNYIPYKQSQITSNLNPDWLLSYAQGANLNLSTTTPKCQCPAGYHAKNIGLLGGSAQWICEKDGGNFYQGAFVKCSNDATVNNPIDSVTSFFNSIQQLTTWLSDPVRIIKLAGGFMLIGIALLLLINPTAGLAGQAVKGIQQAIPRPAKSFAKGAK
jgi:murein DD-endopeptidase MepM/ murein hydrolase activator NlpD